MALKLKPLGDRVVIRPITREQTTKSGIVLPDTAKEKPQEGEVIAVGPGARDESGKLVPLDLKAGDSLDWECEINNDSDQPLAYTNEVQTGEMCNIWGSSVGPTISCFLQ